MKVRILALFALAASVFAAGTVTQSLNPLGSTGNFALTFNWTGDAVSGSVPITAAAARGGDGSSISNLQGYRIITVETVPLSPNPSNAYSVALLDAHGGDLMVGAMSGLSSTSVQNFAASTASPPLNGTFSLSITGQAVASAKGRVIIYLGPVTLVNSTAGSPGPTGAAGTAGPVGPAGGGISAAGYNFTAQTPGGSLAAGNNTITLTPMPLGLNGVDTNHRVYVSGGVGTAEACLITGGTGIQGQSSGQVIINCANTHSGAWTLQPFACGIQEAMVAVVNAGTSLSDLPSGTPPFVNAPNNCTVHASLYIYAGMSGLTGGRVQLTAASDFTGTQMVTGDPNLASFLLRDFTLNPNSLAGITTIVGLNRTENSIRDYVLRVQIVNAAANTTGFNLDGDEDSDLMNCQFINFGSGATAVSWHVPGGNARIWGLTTFAPVILKAQVAMIYASTLAGIVSDGFVNSILVSGVYMYPHPTANAYFSVINAGIFVAGNISGCYLVPTAGVNNIPVFKGSYGGTFVVTGTTLDQTAQTGYTFVSAATTTAGAANFYLRGNFLANGSTYGTGAAGVFVFQQADGVIYSAQTLSHSVASVGGTNLFTGMPGTYRIDYTLATGSATGTGTALVQFVWNDADGVRTSSSSTLTLSANAFTSGSYLAVAPSGVIQYATTFVAGSGGNYDLWVTITKVQ